MFKDLDKHDLVCLFKVVPCKNEWGAEFERHELDLHYQGCKLEVIKWTYAEFGCEVEVMRKDYKKHLEETAYEHSLMFVEGQKRK